MEARHVEIERFARKAPGYKRALFLAPHARDLEIGAVVAVVLGVCRRNGWRPEETRVVDLMAGTGLLSVALKAAGFEKTKAAEACVEMLPDGSPGVEFVDTRTFANIRGVLAEIRPQVIVSLAGFHHLIERTGKSIDRLRSVATQASLVSACVDALVPGGILLVADIAEEYDISRISINKISDWDGRAFSFLICGDDELRSALIATSSMSEYEEALSQRFGKLSLSGTLDWFREFVDPNTAVGHDDVAICGPLLQLLAWKYGDALRVARFRCPWVFDDERQAIEFVKQKFGFYVDRPAGEVKEEIILKAMKDYLDVGKNNGSHRNLAWSLGAFIVESRRSQLNASFMPSITFLLFFFSLVMFGRTVVNALFGVGTIGGPILEGMMWVVVGVIGSVCYERLKSQWEQ